PGLPAAPRLAAAALRRGSAGHRAGLLRSAVGTRARAADARERARAGAPPLLNSPLVPPHFAAQHFGLLSLYRVRAGRASDAIARRLDRWFALVVGGGLVVLADALAGSIAFQDRWISPLLGAGVLDLFARTLRDGSIVFVVILTAL